MGTDLDCYVHPDRISSQLICPICTQVLKNPVQTSTEHLFCEEELLEWMSRSSLCPVTKRVLDPEKIAKPSRIILNMLAELEVYCSNKAEGCTWTGAHEHLASHLNSCTFKPRALLLEEVTRLAGALEDNITYSRQLEARTELLVEENVMLKDLVRDYQQRLRIFHALLSPEHRPTHAFEGDSYGESDDASGLDDSTYSVNDAEEGNETEEANFRKLYHRDNTSHRSTPTASSLSDAARLQKLRALQSLSQLEADTKDEGSRKLRKDDKK